MTHGKLVIHYYLDNDETFQLSQDPQRMILQFQQFTNMHLLHLNLGLFHIILCCQWKCSTNLLRRDSLLG